MLTTAPLRRMPLLWFAGLLAASLTLTTALLCGAARSLAAPAPRGPEDRGSELQTALITHAILPVEGVVVGVQPSGDSTSTHASSAHALTVMPGAYTVRASKHGYPDRSTQSVTVPPSRSGIGFASLQTYAVSGSVHDFDGSAAGDVSITASPGGHGTTTGADGAYTLLLVAGTYSLNAFKAGYPSPPSRSVTVPPSQGDVDFVFPPHFTIAGTVRAADGSTVQGALVSASPGGYSTLTGADGGYVLSVAPGTFTVGVSKHPFASPPALTVAVPPSRSGADLAFLQTYSIAGRALDFDSSAMGGVTVGASPGGYVTATDASGAYALTVVAGTYEVRASKVGRSAPPPRSVTVPPGHRDVDFSFPPQALIGGTARDHEGEAVEGATISAFPGGYSGLSDAHGVYTLTVVAGTYALNASKPCLPSPPSQTVTVPPSRSAVDWTFGQTFAVRGTVRDFDETPVAGARISSDPGDCPALSDGVGAYTLTLGSGTYNISIWKGGYPSVAAQKVSVPPERDGVDFSFPQRNVVGGMVRDYDGTALQGVLVRAEPGGHSALTDARGVYTLTVLAGTYNVSAFRSGYPSPDAQSVTVPPNRSDLDFAFPRGHTISGEVRAFGGYPVGGALVAAAPGGYSTLTDFSGGYILRVLGGAYSVSVSKVGFSSPPPQSVSLPPDRPGVSFTFLQAFAIGGTVRDHDDTPISGVSVTANPGGYVASTDNRGDYTLLVAAGIYDVSAVKPGFPVVPSQRVSVPPSRNGINFAFPQRASISGMVRDFQGRAVQDALVSASPGNDFAFTAADGRYTLYVVAGTYTISVAKSGHPSPPGRSVTVPPNRGDVDFTFLPTFAVGGSVREFDGAPISQAEVTVSPGGMSTRTDAGGLYTLYLSSGTYSVHVSKQGYPALPPRTVTVPPERTDVHFAFPQRFIVSGTVRDFDGTTVRDAVILAQPGGHSTLSDAGGAYTLTLEAGAYSVSVSKPGYPEPPALAISLPPSRNAVDFAFAARYDIEGIVRDYDGTPVPGAQVSTAPVGYVGSADALGVYTLTVVTGSYAVSASKPGYGVTAVVSVTVPPSRSNVDLFFQQRYAIGGWVRDEAGTPLSDVVVSASPGAYFTATSQSGLYTLHVIAGTYTLTAFRLGYPSPPSQTATVPPNREVNFTFPRRYMQFLSVVAAR